VTLSTTVRAISASHWSLLFPAFNYPLFLRLISAFGDTFGLIHQISVIF